MAELLLLIAGFLVLSGLLAMADAAILSVSYGEVEEMAVQKKWGAQPLKLVTRRLTRSVVVLVILTSIVNIAGPILVGERAVQVYGSSMIGIITAVLTFGTIILSEIIPKAIGTHYAPTVSRAVAPVILLIIYALFPLVIALEKLAGLFKVGKRSIGTEEQIRALARIGGRSGHILETERELIHRVFILHDRRARDLMTPRNDIIALSAAFTIREALADIAKHQHSRYPVYERTLDRIRGIVMTYDLQDALAHGKGDEPIVTVQREVLFIPATMHADSLLSLFRRRHIHLAVVLDGITTVGIISLEDVLEELVGEIEDERDDMNTGDPQVAPR